jgi:uncharacterized protein YbjT (DUF2867 family)
MTQTKILLTGATGSVGSELVKKLTGYNVPFKALVRNSDSSGSLTTISQAEIVQGDLADEARLRYALQGIEKAFLLTSSTEQAEQLQLNFVNAAHAAGVKHIVKLSQLAADVRSPVRFLRYHAAVENRIKELGITYTFLRPNLYMQGLIAFKNFIKEKGQFYASVGHATISAVDIRDIATVAAMALTRDGHENTIYNISGEASITHYQMAEIFSQILGKKISFIDVTPDQMEGAVRAAGFPEWQIGGLIEDYAHYARGEASAVYSTVKDVTGSHAISFEQFVNDYKALFS